MDLLFREPRSLHHPTPSPAGTLPKSGGTCEAQVIMRKLKAKNRREVAYLAQELVQKGKLANTFISLQKPGAFSSRRPRSPAPRFHLRKKPPGEGGFFSTRESTWTLVGVGVATKALRTSEGTFVRLPQTLLRPFPAVGPSRIRMLPLRLTGALALRSFGFLNVATRTQCVHERPHSDSRYILRSLHPLLLVLYGLSGW